MYSNEYDRVKGRWSGKTYTTLRKLGAGGIGEIYLVADDDGKSFAMKISQDLVSITKEYANLNKFDRMCFAPKVYELDDCEKNNKLYHFFIMEYIEGYTLRDAISKEKLPFGSKLDIVRIMADVLKGINEQGYVYTDLKYENIMIDKSNRLIRLIDLGSITPIGDRVKEYTPMYDRSNWNAGSRTADLSYQVFAIIILLISMLLNKDINPETEKLPMVLKRLKKCNFPQGLYDMVNSCLDGSIADCGSLCDSLDTICRFSFAGRRLTHALNAVIAVLSVLLAVLIRTVFA
ncbi:MAG TPA: AarF/UbiB family protein [Clostridia bacterium]|nr:AarF/UbiB family protein [Clostridia bacterium]